MGIQGVMFDFAGTLFALEPDSTWLAKFHGDGAPRSMDELGAMITKLTSINGQLADLDDAEQRAWDNRDLDADLHRTGYLAVLRGLGLTNDSAEAYYGLASDAHNWRPYPDTVDVLLDLRRRGIPVAVVSNIGWDIRPAFRAAGVHDAVDAFVLSYEHRVCKPDPAIFRRALDAIGVPGDQALMVGDTASDGAATALGCTFALVNAAPVAQRPDALRRALSENGLP